MKSVSELRMKEGRKGKVRDEKVMHTSDKKNRRRKRMRRKRKQQKKEMKYGRENTRRRKRRRRRMRKEGCRKGRFVAVGKEKNEKE